MRNIKTLCLSLIFRRSAAAGQSEDAIQVVERWAKAFTEADVDTIVSLYASDVVFIGTGSKTIVSKPEDIRQYFKEALLGSRRFSVTLVETSVAHVSETVFVVTALDKLAASADGKTQDLFGRVTFVLAKRESGWKIVNFHRSAMPA